MTSAKSACAAYVRYLETLNRDGVDDLGRYVSETVRFRDPFNDVRGIDRMRAILIDMFDSVDNLRFEVSEQLCDGHVCYMHWRMSGKIRAIGGADDWSIDGVSRVEFEPTGRVTEHVDFWDAASGIYESIPLVGRVLRAIRRRIAVD